MPLFSNSLQHHQRNLWGKKFWLRRFFSDFGFFSNFCQKGFRAVGKRASYVSWRKCWLDFYRNCGFFSNFEQNFIEVLTINFHHCSQNSIPHDQRNNWRKKLSLQFSIFFLTRSDFFLNFWQKYFRKVVKTNFYVSGKKI